MIAGGVIIIIVLAIVLPLALTKSDEPPPTPEDNIPFDSYNPYEIIPHVSNLQHSFTAFLRATLEYNPEHHARALSHVLGEPVTADNINLGVNLKKIPVGINN